MAVDGHVGSNDFLHTLAQGVNVIRSYGTVQTEIDIIAIAHGDVNDDRACGPQFVGGFI